MSNTYWHQFSNLELISMHGIDKEDLDTDSCHDEVDAEKEQNENSCGCAIGCMRCLGMSWIDFY